jgi:hypothetical protein
LLKPVTATSSAQGSRPCKVFNAHSAIMLTG